MHRIEDKFRKVEAGPNPFIDPQRWRDAMSWQERSFEFRLEYERRGQGNKQSR